MRGDIPLVETHFPLILLSPTPRTASILTNTSLLGSKPVAFRVNDWNSTRGCGCYDMHTNSSNIAIQHQVDIVTSDGVKLMPNFPSMKFSLLYLSHMLPGTIKVGTFH
eukprot:7946519-Ditylum_brightwellii.AAC.1